MSTVHCSRWWTALLALFVIPIQGVADGTTAGGSVRGLITCGGEAAQSASYRAPVNIIGQQMLTSQGASDSFLNAIVLGPTEAVVVQTPPKSSVSTGWLFYE